jgi:hypothetical protein
MSWMKFIFWLLGLYGLYYGINIGWDLVKARRLAANGGAGGRAELFFEEAPTPQKVSAEEPEDKKKYPGEKPVAAVSAIGGVNLKELFNLARAEAIVYNRAVTF